MNSTRKKRLIAVLVLLIGASAATGLILFALEENLNHFFTPSELNAGRATVGQKIRVGGLVVENSVARIGDGLTVSFKLTDNQESEVEVRYKGILPDLFREGQGIVATGVVRSDELVHADEVLAKHDENYMPPEAMEAIKGAGHPGNPQY